EVDDPAFVLALEAAFCEQLELVDGLADGQALRHLDDTRHGKALAHTLVSETGHRISVPRQQEPPFAGRPFQQLGVGSLFQVVVADAHDVQLRQTPPKTSDDALGEVVVSGQPHEAATPRGGSSPRAARADARAARSEGPGAPRSWLGSPAPASHAPRGR